MFELLLAGDKFISKMLLKQPGFTYSACGPFTENKESIQKLKKKTKKTGDLQYIYQNKLYKACLQHDMAYGYFKHLNGRTAANKVLCEDLILLKIQIMMNISVDLPQ